MFRARPDPDLGTDTFAISVRAWPYYGSVDPVAGETKYRHVVARLTEHLVATHDMDVIFISTCQGVPDYAFDDSAVANAVVASDLPSRWPGGSVSIAKHRDRVSWGTCSPRSISW